jgi:chemotaxis protein MotA
VQTSTVLGVIIGAFTLVVGLILKGANPSALVNPAALVIIFVGTTAAILNAFPLHQFKKLGVMFKKVFTKSATFDKVKIARDFVTFSHIVRKDGLLALENIKIENRFMDTGISMVVDGVEAEVIETVLDSQIEAQKKRHKLGATLFAQAGMYAPTLGVLGAVIGLVAALGNLNDIERLGHSIAAAFIATLFGIFSGYVLWHPFSNKLKQISQEEIEAKEMIIQAVLSLQAGDPPRIMQFKMLSYIPDKQKEVLMKEWEK